MSSKTRLFHHTGFVPAIVLSLSVYNLFRIPGTANNLSLALSVLGIIAAVLYFFVPRGGKVVFWFWACAQLVVITSAPAPIVDFKQASLYDLTQAVELNFYLPFILFGVNQCGINLCAVILPGILWFTRPRQLLGQCLTFSIYRNDNPLGIPFPLKGYVERYVTLSTENDWLLVRFEKAFTCCNANVQYAFIKRGDKQPIIKNRSNQLVLLKPITDISTIKASGNHLADYRLETWALCW